MARAQIVALGLALGACSPAGKPFSYPLDGTLRLDHVQHKATHNSYHVETTDIPPWEYTMAPLDLQLDQQGVRSVELDLSYIGDDNGVTSHFEVFHVAGVDEGTTCRQFVDCLRTIRGWSVRYPGHLPLYIQLELKDGFVDAAATQYFADLEAVILSVFPRPAILTPDELRGTAATLPAALANGWPTLGGLRGRVFFGLDNRDLPRQRYTHELTSLDGRLCFVDSDPSDPFGAVSIYNDPVPQATSIAAAEAAHFWVRTRADSDGVQARANDHTDLDAALASGAQVVSTDFPVPVAGLAYYVEMPGGTPSRCNPITAPATCTSLALEDPRFVGSR